MYGKKPTHSRSIKMEYQIFSPSTPFVSLRIHSFSMKDQKKNYPCILFPHSQRAKNHWFSANIRHQQLPAERPPEWEVLDDARSIVAMDTYTSARFGGIGFLLFVFWKNKKKKSPVLFLAWITLYRSLPQLTIWFGFLFCSSIVHRRQKFSIQFCHRREALS